MWKIYKNTGYMIWSGGMSMVNSLLVWAIIARYLGPTAFGHFTLIMAVYLVFFNVCSLGLGPLIVREVAADRADRDRFIAGMAVVLTLAGVLWSGIMTTTGVFWGFEPEVLWSLVILSLSLLATALIALCESLLIAEERASVIAAVTTGENVLKAAIPLGLIFLGFGLPAVCAAFTVLRFGTLAVYLGGVYRHRVSFVKPTRTGLMEILRHTPAFLLINLLAGVHFQVGTLLLDRWQNTTEVAMYGAASRLLVPWTLLCVSYTTSVNPTMCRLAFQSMAALGRFCRRSMSNLLAVLLPLAAGTYLVSSQLIRVVFGSGFEAGVMPLRVLIWTLVPLGLVNLLARSLMATNRQRVDAWGNALAVALNVALNVILIPRHGALGVAISQLVSVGFLFLLEFGYVSWTLYPVKLVRLTGRFLIATTAMTALVSYLQSWTLWLIVPIGIGCYGVCLVALGWRPVMKEVGEY